MNGEKMKAKKNQKMNPLLSTEANHAQEWFIEGGDEEDAELVCGLTWKLIEETYGVEECGNLRRSARRRTKQINVDEIDFESGQEDVVPIVGDEDEGDINDD
ncbi:hypothetical protein SETIT_5G389000v2 [Setaria italica]|uniref:Uncharacterized protein n=1 Tax=Setaria italica TaxID=4555 RepID=A0A368RDT2_SETIT|nr:hypothetical protein SETIT_5G389000v2 [Setaria italica]